MKVLSTILAFASSALAVSVSSGYIDQKNPDYQWHVSTGQTTNLKAVAAGQFKTVVIEENGPRCEIDVWCAQQFAGANQVERRFNTISFSVGAWNPCDGISGIDGAGEFFISKYVVLCT
ncbi:hypothetical protein F4810DRAFT_474493 [Camillea tinctor]|nr:hypothetical protein F4810DRAFT_474493 [Camillea tinctor]